MFCPKCGAVIPNGVHNCVQCGTIVQNSGFGAQVGNGQSHGPWSGSGAGMHGHGGRGNIQGVSVASVINGVTL